MTNILTSLQNISQCRNFHLSEISQNVENIVSVQGKPLEAFVRASFCGIPDSGEIINPSDKVFCYEGSVNNPPDAMLNENGDAIEIKKVQTIGTIHLNSSLPKQTLSIDDKTLTDNARTCENWKERDMLYVIGHVVSNKIKSLFFMYGDCVFKNTQFYLDRFNQIKNSLGEIEGLDQTGNEYGTVKNADGLNIHTNMRLRPLNSFDHPFKIFQDNFTFDHSRDFSLFAIMRNEKFEDFDDDSKSDIKSSAINMQHKIIQNPDNKENLKVNTFTFFS